MTTTTDTRNLVAITPVGVLTDDWIVGHFFWYSIEERMMPLSKVRRAFRDNGLDESRLPTERRPEHVAQEACRKVERVTSNGHREEIRAEQVLRDGNTLVYQITRHVQDKQNRVIEHPKALRVIFTIDDSGRGGKLTFEPLDGATQADVQGLIDEITAHYDANSAQIPGHKLRTIVRHYVEQAGAENLRGTSGGVYFMAKTNPLAAWSKLRDYHGPSIASGDFIQRIRMMLEDVYGTAPNFHSIPTINDEGQREFLRRKLVENVSDDAKAFRQDCIEQLATKDKRLRGFRADKLAGMTNKLADLRARKAKFAAILDDTLDDLDTDLGLAEQALRKFILEAES
jgi:hypothetical protein